MQGAGDDMQKLRRVLWTVFPYVLVAYGLFGLARPVVLDFLETQQAQENIVSMESTYDEMAERERESLWQDAVRYDDALLSGQSLVDSLPYEKQLSYQDADMMAHLVIPRLSLDLPIYHGIDANVLMTGVGHVEGSALPVGSVGGRCVLAGHSGMPNARMFDDIHLLREGDRFVVWTLGKPLAYKVIESKVVEPTASEALLSVAGHDLVTLVTCTPYGVNSHRLLVTGERCEYVPDEEEIAVVEAYLNRRTIPLLIGLSIVVLVSVVCFVVRRKRNRES